MDPRGKDLDRGWRKMVSGTLARVGYGSVRCWMIPRYSFVYRRKGAFFIWRTSGEGTLWGAPGRGSKERGEIADVWRKTLVLLTAVRMRHL